MTFDACTCGLRSFPLWCCVWRARRSAKEGKTRLKESRSDRIGRILRHATRGVPTNNKETNTTAQKDATRSVLLLGVACNLWVGCCCCCLSVVAGRRPSSQWGSTECGREGNTDKHSTKQNKTTPGETHNWRRLRDNNTHLPPLPSPSCFLSRPAGWLRCRWLHWLV